MTAFILAVIVNSYNTGQVSVTAAQSCPTWEQGCWSEWLLNRSPQRGRHRAWGPSFPASCLQGALKVVGLEQGKQ